MFDKRYQVQRTFFTVKHFPNSVDAAMPNNIKYYILKDLIIMIDINKITCLLANLNITCSSSLVRS
jgi:hypothetical protein